MHLLPPVRTGVGLVPALIVASFTNLFIAGAVAPWLVKRTRERRGPGAPPQGVVLDRVASGLLVAGAFGLIAAGLAARPTVISETEATEANGRAVRDFVTNHGSAEQRRNLETANAVRLGEGIFRTCIARDDRTKAWCYIVDTNREPPKVAPDGDSRPNGEAFAR